MRFCVRQIDHDEKEKSTDLFTTEKEKKTHVTLVRRTTCLLDFSARFFSFFFEKKFQDTSERNKQIWSEFNHP